MGRAHFSISRHAFPAGLGEKLTGLSCGIATTECQPNHKQENIFKKKKKMTSLVWCVLNTSDWAIRPSYIGFCLAVLSGARTMLCNRDFTLLCSSSLAKKLHWFVQVSCNQQWQCAYFSQKQQDSVKKMFLRVVFSCSVTISRFQLVLSWVSFLEAYVYCASCPNL